MPKPDPEECALCPVGRCLGGDQRHRLRRDRDRAQAPAPHRQGLRRAARHRRRARRGPDRRPRAREPGDDPRPAPTPAGAFGSARFKLKGIEQNRAEYERLIEVFRAHDIGYFFYNGGNDSMDTATRSRRSASSWATRSPASACRRRSTTTCRSPTPARASARSPSTSRSRPRGRARRRFDGAHLDQGVRDGGDGRHAGWIAAAGGLAGARPAMRRRSSCSRRSLRREAFLARVKQSVESQGYCVIVVSEGAGRRRQVPRRRRHPGRLRPRSSAASGRWSRTCPSGPWLQVPLGRRRLPAARRAPHRPEGRRRAGLCGRQGRGRDGGAGRQRR